MKMSERKVGKKPTAKTDAGTNSRRRIKATFVSPSGTTTAMSGDRLDVCSVIEVLVELLRQFRKAERAGWDIATLEQVLRQGKPDDGEAAA
jgi:hypothetical protein